MLSFFKKKQIPPFVVPAAEFKIAELFSLYCYNLVQCQKTQDLFKFYVRNGNKLPDGHNGALPVLVNNFHQFENQSTGFLIKTEKIPNGSPSHSFLMINGQLFALDNKDRHRRVDPSADGLLGKGSYGKVKLGQTNNADLFAVKVYTLSEPNSPRFEKLQHIIVRSWGVLNKLNYLVAAGVRGLKYYTIIPFLKGNNLGEYLIRFYPHGMKDVHGGLNLALKTAWALNYLHERNIVHGDVKENNFMMSELDDGQKLTLFDFDASWDLDSTYTREYISITNAYASPEAQVTMLTSPLTKAADIYQLGHVFKNLNAFFKCDLSSLFREMIRPNPKDRPVIKEVIHQIHRIRENIKKEDDKVFFIKSIGFASIICMGFYQTLTLSLLNLVFISAPLIGLSALFLGMKKAYEWFKNRSFTNLVSEHDEPYEINYQRLDALKEKLDQFSAFKEGYHVNQKGSLLDKASTWLHWRNYSHAYYAGARWCELNPQDNALDQAMPCSSPVIR